jgi:hypothetical protein
MKKIVRRSHIKENFRANLIMEQTSNDTISEAVPFVAAAAGAALRGAAGLAAKYGPSVASWLSKAMSGASKVKSSNAARIAAAKARTSKSRTPATNPWVRSSSRSRFNRKGRNGVSSTRDRKLGASDMALGLAGALGGGSGGSSSPPDIYGKDRPQTGFRNAYQGIDPFRSGEMRASAGYYDTPVGRRQLYKGAGGGLVAPPSTMYENTVFHQLQEMINNSVESKEINSILVTHDMAKNIVQLHEALNTTNKKILEESVQSKDGFFEVLDFSVRN